MDIDWKTLNGKTSEYRTIEITKDLDGQTVQDVVFSGLQVRLSELVGQFPFGGGSTLAIWADTLIVDYPTFDAQATVVITRSIDVSMFGGAALPVRVPAKGETAVSEFLIKESVGEIPFHLTTSDAQAEPPAFTVPCGESPFQVAYFIVESDGSATHKVETGSAYVQDLLDRPWALNSLKASFTAASLLMDVGQAERETATSMLGWVVACIRSLGQGGSSIPEEYAELYSQSAALLVTLNLDAGARYVPILSSKFYKEQIDTLLDALESYETKLETLDIRTDIRDAVREISGTMEGTSQNELVPLRTDLDNISGNINSLSTGIRELQFQFDMQYYDADGKFVIMMARIVDAKINQYLEACFKMAINVTKAGVAVGEIVAGKAEQAGELMQQLADGTQNGYAAIRSITYDVPDDSLPEKAKNLMAVQRQLMVSFQASTDLWTRAQMNEALTRLPDSLTSVAVDPSLAWDNYMVEANRTLTNIQAMIGSGIGAKAAQEAATNYLASLKILAQYGKAINAKFVTYSIQAARATVVKAQIAAVERTQANWQDLKSKAKSDMEQLSALKGVIKNRMDAIKRSIYVAWINFRNAYYYMYFRDPDTTVSLVMDAAQLRDAFAKVSVWIGKLLGDSADGEKIRLPNNDVPLSFEFNIVRQDNHAHGAFAGGDMAFLVPAIGNQPATITMSIPMGDPQLAGNLPERGNVAIWITKANFFIDGVKPNNKGKVIIKASTSGVYENGFGPNQAYSFVTKEVESFFGYSLDNKHVNIKWEVDSAVYMTPTPFTQWTLTFDRDGGDPGEATKLSMNLEVAFRANP